MADISIQFHALPEELLPFARHCMADFGLHAVAMKFFPFEAVEVTSAELDNIFSERSPYRELAFTLDRPVLPVQSGMDFWDKNPDAMRLNIERPSQKGLRQTCLAARTEDTAALLVWRGIARRLKGVTAAGVAVTNPDTGVSVRERTFRYTPGAKALESRGVPMLPIAGGCAVNLG